MNATYYSIMHAYIPRAFDNVRGGRLHMHAYVKKPNTHLSFHRKMVLSVSITRFRLSLNFCERLKNMCMILCV